MWSDRLIIVNFSSPDNFEGMCLAGMIIFAAMYYIIGIIIIGIVLAFILIRTKNSDDIKTEIPEEAPKQIAADCCGAHEVCEFDESDFKEEKIIYFDDEELDELRNVREDQLTNQQIDLLRDVLYTLKTDEINKWLTSINRRHIHLPVILQQEARLLMAEK